MRWLVTGAAGMLGRDLVPLLTAAGHEVSGVDVDQLDITDPSACRQAVPGHDAVVNCAAYTAVDDAEADEARALAINATGPANLARACADAGVPIVQLSTDYVFAGDASTPYAADAPIAPRTAYGRTKAAGEQAVAAAAPRHWIVRTAWLYGEHGRNFPATMARLAGERENVAVVTDEIGQPTWTMDLAAAIERLVVTGAPYGIYHATSSGQCSWFELARAVFDELGLDPDRVRPTTAAAFARAAPRPAYSVLDHGMWAAAGLPALPQWRDALHAAAPSVLRLS